MSRSNSPTGVASTPELYPKGEHIFCMGSTVSGVGTHGLGANAAQEAENQRLRDYKKQYWIDKQAIAQQRAAEEAARLARIEAEQRLSPRKRLLMVLEERELQIKADVQQRKKFEEDFKRSQAEEAAALNAIFTKERAAFKEAHLQAKEDRRIQKELETQAARQKEAELQKRHEEDMKLAEEERIHRCNQLRELRRLERERAQKAAEERQEMKRNDVTSSKQQQGKRLEMAHGDHETIVKLKGEFISVTKKRLLDAVEESRDELFDSHHRAAKEIAAAEENWQQQRKQRTEEYVAAKNNHVKMSKTESRKCVEECRMQRQKQLNQLQQQAKDQRAKGREAIEEERLRLQNERAEHIANAKELIAKRSSPTSSSGH